MFFYQIIDFIHLLLFNYSNYYRSASEWHSICQLKPEKPTKTVLMDDCKRVGEFDADPNNILYQLIDTEESLTINGTSINVIATNMEFAEIKLSHKFDLAVFNPRRKTSQPLDAIDCAYLLEFNCGTN